ncbi:MAG TPA: thioredoxin family protein [Xanthobacteraceae bacterium]
MPPQKIASRDQWLIERKALLARERELTHLRDELSAARRALPWVAVEESYHFDGPDGRESLADLFGGRSQLAIYHFMLTPGSDHVCPGCAFLADHIDAARMHFEHADLSLVAVSRAPLSQIEPVKKRMGWRFKWVSSSAGAFNFDYGVSFTAQQIAKGATGYNYGTTPYANPDLPGTSIFAKDGAGRVFHTYSTYSRGSELLLGAFNWLDLTPKGRNEDGTMSWVKLHDQYDEHPGAEDDCCRSAPSST